MDLLAGRYRLEGKLGEGGMAVVYRAEDRVLRRTVAVTIPREPYASDAAFRQRFHQEAQATARLSHPHIVSLYDAGEADGHSFLVMEYVDGPNLKHVLQRGPLPISEAVSIALQACDALAFAHARGVVHCDVKPQNILLQPLYPGGQDPAAMPAPALERYISYVKLVDFGIALAAEDAVTPDGERRLGSMPYASPEQVVGLPCTAVSDLYSLGVVLYEMLAGQPPFDGGSGSAMALRDREKLPPSLRQLNPQVPATLERMASRAMAREPESRFASAAAMRDELERLLHVADEVTAPVGSSSRPGRAGTPSTAYGRPPSSNSAGRRLLLSALGGGVVLLFSAVVALASIAADRGGVIGGLAGGIPEPLVAAILPATPTATATPTPTSTPTPTPTATPTPTPTLPPQQYQSFVVDRLGVQRMPIRLQKGNRVVGHLVEQASNNLTFGVEGPSGQLAVAPVRVQGRYDFQFEADEDGVYLLLFENNAILTRRTLAVWWRVYEQ